MDISSQQRRLAFTYWLRTGWWSVEQTSLRIERKFNPWHDPENGQFTTSTGSGGFSQSRTSQGGNRPDFGGGGGATGRWDSVEKRTISSGGKAKDRDAAFAALSLTAKSKWAHAARNGYDFQIDDAGRMRTAAGVVTVSDAPARSRTAQSRAGGSDRLRSDDGGHYIAARLNGPTDAFNHFAQDANFNRGSYRAIEQEWAQATRHGKTVSIRIEPVYPGRSQRPSEIMIWYSISGKEKYREFSNRPAGVGHAKR